MRRVAACGLALSLAACGAPPPPGIDGVMTGPPATYAVIPDPAQDTCGAAPHAALVGQPATALERVLIMRQVRLIRPGTPVTEDVRPERINFHIATPPDAPEILTAITCG